MTDTQIEQIAEAIAEASALLPGYWQRISERTRYTYRRMARAALDAVNPPDREFVDDMGCRWEWCGGEAGTWAWRMTGR